ncbi:MAG TPA: hypothetical protein VEB21_00450, partial [Terriglobales bacterium]|nr:hypothetical protein [Terriglobales bacterium]
PLGDSAVQLSGAAADAAGLPIAVAAAAADARVIRCGGDCDGSGQVNIGEVVRAINQFGGIPICGGAQPVRACPAADRDRDGVVSIGEVQASLLNFGSGCPSGEPSPSDLSAVIDDTKVMLAWQPPHVTWGHTETLILRRLNQPPTGPTDSAATEVFRGGGSAAEDALTALLPDTADQPRQYFYAAYGCKAADGPCATESSFAAVEMSLVQALHAGGYVLHWRHAAADLCVDRFDLGTADMTSVPDWWRSCDANCATATARQLIPEGVVQATEIGNQMRARAIEFDRVLSSEFCRNFGTAELMALGPEIELVQGLTFNIYPAIDRCETSYNFIQQVPAAGKNTAVIGHTGFVPSCPVLGNLSWGQAAIFKPDGAGAASLIALVHAHEWAALAP